MTRLKGLLKRDAGMGQEVIVTGKQGGGLIAHIGQLCDCTDHGPDAVILKPAHAKSGDY
jgi:hypothetical protein